MLSQAILAAILMSGWVNSASALTGAEADSVLFMKQEEKVARAVCQALSAYNHLAAFTRALN